MNMSGTPPKPQMFCLHMPVIASNSASVTYKCIFTGAKYSIASGYVIERNKPQTPILVIGSANSMAQTDVAYLLPTVIMPLTLENILKHGPTAQVNVVASKTEAREEHIKLGKIYLTENDAKAQGFISGPAAPQHPLQIAFNAAIAQATSGKGTRHGGAATPFFKQRWYHIAKSTGIGGLMYQVAKKAEEACEKDDDEAFERELLGSIVYAGMAYLYFIKHGRGKASATPSKASQEIFDE